MFHVLTVWLHVLAAAVWIGGAEFLAFVAVPVARRHARDDREYVDLLEAVVLRFRTVAWAALVVLVATGILQMASHGFAAMLSGRIGAVLIVKLGLVLTALALSAVHDFALGPRALDAMRRDAASAETERLRATAGWIGRVTFLLALGIVACAVMLFRPPF